MYTTPLESQNIATECSCTFWRFVTGVVWLLMAILNTHLFCEPSGFDMTEEFTRTWQKASCGAGAWCLGSCISTWLVVWSGVILTPGLGGCGKRSQAQALDAENKHMGLHPGNCKIAMCRAIIRIEGTNSCFQEICSAIGRDPIRNIMCEGGRPNKGACLCLSRDAE